MSRRENINSQQFLINNDNNNNNSSSIDIRDDEEYMKSNKKHGILCCPVWICVSITAAILVFIGIMTFVFWPKIPDVNISGITLSQPADGSQAFRYEIPNSGNGNKGGIEIDLDIHVSVKNDNFYNLNVNNLDTRVYLQTDSLERTIIGKGKASSLSFPKHETTEFVLPVTIGYYVEDILKDNALLYLLKACTAQSSINIQYEVDIGIFLIENIYTPTYKGDQAFTCPVSNVADGLAGGLSSVLLSDVYSNISQYLSSYL